MRPPQATIASYDTRTGGGTVLLDDGTSLSFHRAAVDPRMRMLRLGQRVGMRLQDGQVTSLTLLTLL